MLESQTWTLGLTLPTPALKKKESIHVLYINSKLKCYCNGLSEQTGSVHERSNMTLTSKSTTASCARLFLVAASCVLLIKTNI